VRPNLQGQPCCYKIPKRIEYSIKKVAQRYAAANVKVPEDVRRIFGIGLNTNNKLNNVGRAAPVAVLTRDPKSGFMIGSRQALRYSKVALVDIAKRMNIQVPRVISKAELAKKIEEAGARTRDVVKNAIQTKKKDLRITKKAIKEGLTRLSGRSATDKNVANFIQFLKNSNTGAPATKASVNAAKNAFIKSR
jgi:predicted flap endonuclease-1-like 5' DNA nuclease